MSTLKDLLRDADPAATQPASTPARRAVVVDRALTGAAPAPAHRPFSLRWALPAALVVLLVIAFGSATSVGWMPNNVAAPAIVRAPEQPWTATDLRTHVQLYSGVLAEQHGTTKSDPYTSRTTWWWGGPDADSYSHTVHSGDDTTTKKIVPYTVSVGSDGYFPHTQVQFAQLPVNPQHAAQQLHAVALQQQYKLSNRRTAQESASWDVWQWTLGMFEKRRDMHGDRARYFWAVLSHLPGVQVKRRVPDGHGGHSDALTLHTVEWSGLAVRKAGTSLLGREEKRLDPDHGAKSGFGWHNVVTYGVPERSSGVPGDIREKAQTGT